MNRIKSNTWYFEVRPEMRGNKNTLVIGCAKEEQCLVTKIPAEILHVS